MKSNSTINIFWNSRVCSLRQVWQHIIIWFNIQICAWCGQGALMSHYSFKTVQWPVSEACGGIYLVLYSKLCMVQLYMNSNLCIVWWIMQLLQPMKFYGPIFTKLCIIWNMNCNVSLFLQNSASSCQGGLWQYLSGFILKTVHDLWNEV